MEMRHCINVFAEYFQQNTILPSHEYIQSNTPLDMIIKHFLYDFKAIFNK